MQELHSISLREYKLGEPGNGGHGDGFAPTPLNLSAADLEDEAAEVIKDVAATIGVWGDWRHILRVLPAHLAELCQTSHADDGYRRIASLNRRLNARVERRRVKPFVGVCPDCRRNIEADDGEHGMVCKCGHWLDLDSLRAQTREQWSRQHTTQTPAGAARWVSGQTGIGVSRQDIKNWIRRGKLHPVKLEDGYCEFRIGELVELAESKTQ